MWHHTLKFIDLVRKLCYYFGGILAARFDTSFLVPPPRLGGGLPGEPSPGCAGFPTRERGSPNMLKFPLLDHFSPAVSKRSIHQML